MEYYLLLRSVLRTKPRLRACLTRCRHCRVFFLTHPRNAGRHNLRCPFGCRQAHRKRQSTQRSVAYYQEVEGKTKKRALNGKRRAPQVPDELPKPLKNGARASVSLDSLAAWSAPMVEHVRMVSSLIAGRPVSRRAVLEMLEMVVRQHTIALRRKIGQAVAWINENPP
jgi:hypothetical protein